MAELSESEQLAYLQARMAVASPEALPNLSQIIAFLVESEDQMLLLIQYINDPSLPPVVPDQGDVEFGFVLYWIHHPPPTILAYLAAHPLLQYVYDALLLLAPQTKITTLQYNQLIAALGDYGVSWNDGTIYGATYQYQQLDSRWMLAALNYAVNVMGPGLIHPFPNNQAANIALAPKAGA